MIIVHIIGRGKMVMPAILQGSARIKGLREKEVLVLFQRRSAAFTDWKEKGECSATFPAHEKPFFSKSPLSQ